MLMPISRSIVAAATTLLAAALHVTPLSAQSEVPGAAARASAPASAASDVALGVGDAVRITVWRNAELSCDCTVGPDGSLSHPLYRAVHVAGVPMPEVEARVRRFLQQFETRPQFVVEPLVRIAVGGEVARPDLYLLPPNMTVAQALAHAGGARERGRRDRVLVLRGRAQVVLDLTGADPADLLLPIRSGDQLVVEQHRSAFRDVLMPVIGVVGSVAAIASVVIRAQNR